ncbi:MAG: hypothetical protein P4L73_13435 [Caulobacteraceae bacterium]|nr:hypothetical protein [Caulobacteraceae bacterium]
MRIFRGDQLARCMDKVRVCGEVVHDVLMADEEAGEVRRFARDADGRTIFNAANEPCTELLKGDVEIVWRDPPHSPFRRAR